MLREGTDWQSMTHQSYFMECFCLSALLIKYSLLGNALPVRPCWLIIIPSPWLWNISCRSIAAICSSLPGQIFYPLPQFVEGDTVPLRCRPPGPLSAAGKPRQLLLGEDPLSSSVLGLSTCRLNESCWRWKRIDLLLVWTGTRAFN